MNDNKLKELAAQYGTPSYVFDTEALRNRATAIKEIFGNNIFLCYSIKANPFLIPAMLKVVDKLEVCSPGELLICESLAADRLTDLSAENRAHADAATASGESFAVPESLDTLHLHESQESQQDNFGRIVYSGVCKTKADIDRAILDRVGIYTAESIPQLKLLQAGAADAGIKIPVLLRLNSGAQFGMSREDMFEILEHLDEYPNISVEGLHYFAGTQRKNLKHQQKELEMLRGLFDDIRSTYSIALPKLEYGPGLAVPLFANDDFSDTLRPARELAPVLQEVSSWCELTVEMGRFFVTECGYYLTRVMETKHVEDKYYCLVDGGINHVNYLGQIMGMKLPVIRHFRNVLPDLAGAGAAASPSSPATLEAPLLSDAPMASADGATCRAYALCGSLCTTNDDLVREIIMDDPRPGDVLCFENIGAYSVTEGIYLFLSRTMPRIILYNGETDVVLARDFMETSVINTIRPATR